jgi:hypothetical protein
LGTTLRTQMLCGSMPFRHAGDAWLHPLHCPVRCAADQCNCPALPSPPSAGNSRTLRPMAWPTNLARAPHRPVLSRPPLPVPPRAPLGGRGGLLLRPATPATGRETCAKSRRHQPVTGARLRRACAGCASPVRPAGGKRDQPPRRRPSTRRRPSFRGSPWLAHGRTPRRR